MKKFEIGKTYSCFSICNTECVWTFKVVSRTAKTVTFLNDDGKIQKNRIAVWDNSEIVKPFGTYSMSPTLRAEREVA